MVYRRRMRICMRLAPTLCALFVAAAVLALGLSMVFGAAPALAAKGKKTTTKTTTKPKPAPLPGWVVDRVRVEPVDGDGEIDVAGVGSYRGAIEIGRQPVTKPLIP